MPRVLWAQTRWMLCESIRRLPARAGSGTIRRVCLVAASERREEKVLMEQMTPVLVVTPHPDDAEGGAGGIIARWTKQGRKVVLVVCTNGDKGTSDRSITPEALAKIREEEQRKAASVLGIAEVVFLRFPDQGLEDCTEFREQLVRLIRLHRPGTVVT